VSAQFCSQERALQKAAIDKALAALHGIEGIITGLEAAVEAEPSAPAKRKGLKLSCERCTFGLQLPGALRANVLEPET
jgi:hypothetical protein